jgi:isorenieratene synthase
VHRADSAPLEADAVVLAVTVPALKALVDASPDLDDPEWRRAVDELDVTLPFAVWRLWLDEPLRPDRTPFAGTAGCGILDNISVYERFQGEARRWVEQNGGSVVELHAYAVPEGYDEAGIKAEMKRYLEVLYPEARESRPVDERFILARDCPAFAPGSSANRPTVVTPFPGVALAGDLVRLRQPSALMERAVTSGFLAANELLAGWRVRAEPVLGIPERGLLARPRLGGRRTG